MSLLLHTDWLHTSACIRGGETVADHYFAEKEGGTFLCPMLGNLENNWGNRGGMVELAEKAVSAAAIFYEEVYAVKINGSWDYSASGKCPEVLYDLMRSFVMRDEKLYDTNEEEPIDEQ